MVFKWVLILFAALAVGLLILSKVLALLVPPRPGRPPSPLLTGVTRALRMSVIVPAALALVLLAIAMLGGR